MARLIDAMQTVTKMSGRITPLIRTGANPVQVYNEALQVLAEAPTVDAVEVVRCKGCKNRIYSDFDGCYVCHHGGFNAINPEHFCSYGERRTDGS